MMRFIKALVSLRFLSQVLLAALGSPKLAGILGRIFIPPHVRCGFHGRAISDDSSLA